MNDRIMTVRFQSRHAKTTIIRVYAPTGDSAEADKEAFYDLLQGKIDKTPSHHLKLLMGDLNAKISGDRTGME